MEFLFTDAFRGSAYGPSSATPWNDIFPTSAGTLSLKLTMFSRCPVWSSSSDIPGTTGNDHIASIPTLTSLKANPAWTAVGEVDSGIGANGQAPLGTMTNSSVIEADGAAFKISAGSGFDYWAAKPSIVQGFSLSIVDAGEDWDDLLVCVFRPASPIYMTGESGAKAKVSSTNESGTESWWFRIIPNLTENRWDVGTGLVKVSVPVIKWESARATHVWIDPQRINYVANPSFENTSLSHWRSLGTLTRVAGESGIKVLGGGTPHAARIVGTNPVMESNLFPASDLVEGWSVSAAISGTGYARIGLVFFPPNMDEDNAFYVHSDWTKLSGSGTADQQDFKRVSTVFPAQQSTKEALVRIEFKQSLTSNTSGTFYVDQVIAEPNISQLEYFDGSTPLGNPEDYRWYGTESGQGNATGRSFSLYYNNRRNLRNYLFGYTDAENKRVRGEAERWVPEGLTVIPHWDDVFQLRTHSWLDDIPFPIKDYVVKNVVTSL